MQDSKQRIIWLLEDILFLWRWFYHWIPSRILKGATHIFTSHVHVLPLSKFYHLAQFKNLSFLYIFLGARVCWPLLCICRPFMIYEGCLNSNSECCRSKRARNQTSHPSMKKKSIFWKNLLTTNQHLGLWINHDYIPAQWSYPEPELVHFWMLGYGQEVFTIRKTD